MRIAANRRLDRINQRLGDGGLFEIAAGIVSCSRFAIDQRERFEGRVDLGDFGRNSSLARKAAWPISLNCEPLPEKTKTSEAGLVASAERNSDWYSALRHRPATRRWRPCPWSETASLSFWISRKCPNSWAMRPSRQAILDAIGDLAGERTQRILRLQPETRRTGASAGPSAALDCAGRP